MEQHRICLVNDSFPPTIDGVANAVVNYAEIITRKHGSATVITPYYPDADDSKFPFPVLRYPSVDMTKLVGYRAGLPFSPETLRSVEKSGFDLIHSHCPVSSTMLARSLREAIPAPLVFTYHTKFDIDIANAIKGKRLQEEAIRLLVSNISACDEVWTVSRGAGDNLRSLGYQGDIRVMPNGVDLPLGRVAPEKLASVCAPYDLPDELPVFLFVGRMMWYKGLRLTLDALKRLKDSGKAFRMVFIGGGGDKEEVVAYSNSLGLDKEVLFIPPIHDREAIRAWYCRADLFLFPSSFDTNGLVVREAAACALASVLVRGSCAAEDVSDGQNGFLIDESAESMAALLQTLCQQRETMHRVGENAQRELYLSWEDAVGRANERYGVVIENYKRGLYPAHGNLSDELIRATAKAMEGLNRRLNRLDELKSELLDERQRVMDTLDEISQRIDRFL